MIKMENESTDSLQKSVCSFQFFLWTDVRLLFVFLVDEVLGTRFKVKGIRD